MFILAESVEYIEKYCKQRQIKVLFLIRAVFKDLIYSPNALAASCARLSATFSLFCALELMKKGNHDWRYAPSAMPN